MSNYYVRVFTDDSNEIEWKNLIPDEIHYIEFKGKRYAEVRHGKWIGKPIAGYSTVKCSVCGVAYTENSGRWSYCPNCGSDMRSIDDEVVDLPMEEPEINPCRGCEDYDGQGGCISKGGCGARMVD